MSGRYSGKKRFKIHLPVFLTRSLVVSTPSTRLFNRPNDKQSTSTFNASVAAVKAADSSTSPERSETPGTGGRGEDDGNTFKGEERREARSRGESGVGRLEVWIRRRIVVMTGGDWRTPSHQKGFVLVTLTRTRRAVTRQFIPERDERKKKRWSVATRRTSSSTDLGRARDSPIKAREDSSSSSVSPTKQ